MFRGRGDMKQVARHPDASRDANRQATDCAWAECSGICRQLMVGAAVAAEDLDAWERTEACHEAGNEDGPPF